ncbi:MAG: ATP-binding protein [Ginsengibacter sp.]
MKIKLLLAAAVMLIASAAKSQSNEIEKLKTQINSHPQQDTFRVNRLNDVGLIDDLPADEKQKVANEALLISSKINYSLGAGYALLNLGDANTQMGKKQEADAFLMQADSIVKKTGDQELAAYVLLRMAENLITTQNRKALNYYLQAEAIAEKTGNNKLLSICQRRIGAIYNISFTDYPRAMKYLLKSISTAEAVNCLDCLAASWSNLADLYNVIGDQKNSLLYYKKAEAATQETGNTNTRRSTLNNIGERYRLMGNYPEALKSYEEALAIETRPYNIELLESNMADVYTHMDSLLLAFQYGFHSLAAAKQLKDREGEAWINGILSRAYLKKNMADSAIWHAQQGLAAAKETGSIEFMRDNTAALANAYAATKDFANAYTYHILFINFRDSMLNAEITNKSTVLKYNYDLAKKQTQITALNEQRKTQKNFLISALIVLVLIIITTFVLLRNNRQKQKANKLLQKQKHEIEEQRDQTKKVLTELQQTQKQLIQSEKMASLGELTAGIAHEIQNPLNFVNNFSEVNTELIEEATEELDKGNSTEVKNILQNIKANEEKINHHGKRADSIVKGMLQHSRQTTGEKEPTDLNALCDEYLRLSYQGLRAKDKSFNSAWKTDFDESIGSINIIPQDIGRVLLNLYNNAFYACTERSRSAVADKLSRQAELVEAGLDYQPTVSVQTKKLDDKVEITVKDNGNGIPQNIVDKIFQPFFTTKPAGQGTGLGLSLAYDIIKAHGGEIKVETKESERTEFIIQLPID